MIQKSSASLQGALFSELKELLALIGDAKKSKEQVELLAEDVAALKELYQKNQQETEKQSDLLVQIESKNAETLSLREELKEKEELLLKKAKYLAEKDSELTLLSEKLNKAKEDFELDLSSKLGELDSAMNSLKKEKELAVKLKEESELLKSEYEEKLSKLKAMVG